MIFYQLTGTSAPTSKTDVLNSLGEVVLDHLRNAKSTVVIIDEAHTIEDPSVLEEIRLLLNFQSENQFLLTLLLFGQPELKTKIDKNIQLEQRIHIRRHLSHLNEDDTIRYILHRLAVAGRTEWIFTEESLRLINDHSGGIPRRINRLCDICLLSGFTKKVKRIDEQIVQEEIKEMK